MAPSSCTVQILCPTPAYTTRSLNSYDPCSPLKATNCTPYCPDLRVQGHSVLCP